jgi:putative aldouronate transport system substrate-binding protein
MDSCKIIAFISTALLAAAFLSGCSGRKAGAPSLPETGLTLSYWVDLDTNVSANFTNLGDTPFGRGLQKETGVKINFIHPPAGAASEQFNLILASGEFPDIMERNWTGYSGGPEKAIDDGIILRLNDSFDRDCPNLATYLKANPDIDRMVKTDNASYYMFPFVRGDPGLNIARGHMIRQDWLDDLGLPMPGTIDEWHTVLTAFKEQKGAASPLSFEYTYLTSINFNYAFRAELGMYVGEDGVIRYGPGETAYRDWVENFAQWYREGLLDSDFATLHLPQVTAKVVGGQTGATAGALGSRMGTWTASARAANPGERFSLVAAPVPTLRKGEKPYKLDISNPVIGVGAAITTACGEPEAAMRFLDWAYSAQGGLYYNFGTEGESYTLVNGYPAYTDTVMKNPSGWPIAQALAAYARPGGYGPFVQDIRYFEQYMALEEQRNAIKVWEVPGSAEKTVPPLTPTPEESREYSQIMNEINTYKNEMFLKFVLGTESFDAWDAYLATLGRLGIERALEIQNAALARYKAR